MIRFDRGAVAVWSELADRAPAHAVVGEVDLVITRYDDKVSVLYGAARTAGR